MSVEVSEDSDTLVKWGLDQAKKFSAWNYYSCHLMQSEELKDIQIMGVQSRGVRELALCFEIPG